MSLEFDIGGIDDISFIYQGKHNLSGSNVSLIYTDLSLSLDIEFIEELKKTVINSKNFQHPNLLRYECCFVENMRLWCVCYPILGTCKYIMTQQYNKGFAESQVASIIAQILLALVYLHGRRIIHNDIKAGNIVVKENGIVQLAANRQNFHLTHNGEYKKGLFSAVGDNIEWSAPEIMLQNANYNEKADIYSVGIR